jgi:L-fuculose-phosphate aldolase
MPAPPGQPDGIAPKATEEALRRALAGAGSVLAAGGLVVASDGNLSARLPDGRLLVTPSGSRKGLLDPADLLVCRPDGTAPAAPAGARPSSEVLVHVRVYGARPDAGAIVHAHPRAVVALSLAGGEVAVHALPEVLAGVGRVATAPYGTPGTDELARRVETAAREADAIILERHGALTIGRTVEEALFRMERLAWAAEVSALARLLGGGAPPAPLPHAEVLRLLARAGGAASNALTTRPR